MRPTAELRRSARRAWSSAIPASQQQGFHWSPATPAGSFVPSRPVLGEEVRPLAVDAAGNAVGLVAPAGHTGALQAFRSSAGEMTRLPPLVDGLAAMAFDLNEGGTIVGLASPRAETATAVYWQDGEIHRLDEVDELGGNVAGATAVNEGGTIVGYANTADIEFLQAFRWTGPGSFEVLPPLVEMGLGDAADVNEAGVTVGRADVPDESGWPENRAVYWDEQGDIHELPRLYETPEVQALAINDRGVIVGYEQTPEFVTTEARLWVDGEVHDLQGLMPDVPEEYRLAVGADVNDRDEVLAHAFVEDGGPIRLVTLLLRPDLSR